MSSRGRSGFYGLLCARPVVGGRGRPLRSGSVALFPPASAARVEVLKFPAFLSVSALSSLLWGWRARGWGLGGASGLGGGAPVPAPARGRHSWSFYYAGWRGCSPLRGLALLWGFVVVRPRAGAGCWSFPLLRSFCLWRRWGWCGVAFMLAAPFWFRGRICIWPSPRLSRCAWQSMCQQQKYSPAISWRGRCSPPAPPPCWCSRSG